MSNFDGEFMDSYQKYRLRALNSFQRCVLLKTRLTRESNDYVELKWKTQFTNLHIFFFSEEKNFNIERISLNYSVFEFVFLGNRNVDVCHFAIYL